MACIVLPDTAEESYKGTFITDVYDPMSTVKQPDFLHFPKGIYKVLKLVHPDTGIDLGAMYVMEDYNRHLLRSITEQAARLTIEKRCQLLADYVQAPGQALDQNLVEVQAKDFVIVGEDGAKYLIYHKAEDPEDPAEGWEAKHVVEQYLRPQLAEWESKNPTEKKNVFDEWLVQARDKWGEYECFDYYPGQIIARDIQTAVRLCLPNELAKHAVNEGTRAVTSFTCRGNENASRSVASGLQYDVDQIGALMCQTTSMVVGQGAAVYLSAVMEYMTAEALELGGNAAREKNKSWIIPRHMQFVFRSDEELNKFTSGITIMSGGVLPNIDAVLFPRKGGASMDDKEDDELLTVLNSNIEALKIAADSASDKEDDEEEDRLRFELRSLKKEKKQMLTILQRNRDRLEFRTNLSFNWVANTCNEDENIDEEFDEYQDLLVAASKSEDPHCELLCYDKDHHFGVIRVPEGALTPETLDAMLVEKFGEEQKERIAAAQQKSEETPLSVVLEKANAARAAAAAAKRGAFLHHRVLRESIQGITKHQINRIAARGGCVKVSQLIYEKIRGVTKVFLESILRDTVTFTEHERSFTVAPEHVLSACARQGRMLWGTGRLPLPIHSIHKYQPRGPDCIRNGWHQKWISPELVHKSKRGGFLHEFTVRMAEHKHQFLEWCNKKNFLANLDEMKKDLGVKGFELFLQQQKMSGVNLADESFAETPEYSTLTYAKHSRCNYGGSIEEHEKELAQKLVDAKNSAIEEEYAKQESERERAQEKEEKKEEEKKAEDKKEEEKKEEEKKEESSVPLTDEQEKNRRLHSQSLDLVFKMQRSTERVIPFRPLGRLCMEIGQDFKTDLYFSPVAINLLGELLESYLVGLFEDSNLNAIHRLYKK